MKSIKTIILTWGGVVVASASMAGAGVPLVRDKATPYDRPATVPAASDVSMRSLRFRPFDANDPHNTFDAMDRFHATRLEWVYLADTGYPINPDVRAKVQRVHDSGRIFGGTANSSSGTYVEWHDETGKHVKKYMIEDIDGNPLVIKHMIHWAHPQSPGCMNNPHYREGHLKYMEEYLDYGADTIQRDEADFMVDFAKMGEGCFCHYCMDGFRAYLDEHLSDQQLGDLGIDDISTFNYKDYVKQLCAEATGDLAKKAPALRSNKPEARKLHELYVQYQLGVTDEFFKWLRSELTKYKDGERTGMSNNNRSFQDWDDPFRMDFDFAIAELRNDNASPWHIYERSQKARSLGKMQVFGTPKSYGEDYDKDLMTRYRRQTVATSYASGALCRVPWDMFEQSRDGNARFFGKPENFADMFAFVRANDRYLAGYCTAGASGPGIEDGRYGDAFPLQAEGANEKLYMFLRAVPGDPSAPIVVHLVDWDEQTSKPFALRINTDAFFPGRKLKVMLRTPAPYDSKAHAEAEGHAQAMRHDGELLGPAQAEAYEPLVDSVVLPTKVVGGYTEVRVPALNPWGMLIVEPQE